MPSTATEFVEQSVRELNRDPAEGPDSMKLLFADLHNQVNQIREDRYSGQGDMDEEFDLPDRLIYLRFRDKTWAVIEHRPRDTGFAWTLAVAEVNHRGKPIRPERDPDPFWLEIADQEGAPLWDSEFNEFIELEYRYHQSKYERDQKRKAATKAAAATATA